MGTLRAEKPLDREGVSSICVPSLELKKSQKYSVFLRVERDRFFCSTCCTRRVTFLLLSLRVSMAFCLACVFTFDTSEASTCPSSGAAVSGAGLASCRSALREVNSPREETYGDMVTELVYRNVIRTAANSHCFVKGRGDHLVRLSQGKLNNNNK